MESKRGSILLVDDDEVFSKVFGNELSRLGFDVTKGYGTDVLSSIKEFQPDVVILDIVMPKVNGLELLKQIKKSRPTLDVIMLTGNAAIENALTSMKEGAYDYFTKPVELDRVEQVLKRCLEQRKLRSKNQMLKKRLSDLREGQMIGVSPAITGLNTVLQSLGWQDVFYLGIAQPLPKWLQFIVALFVVDFLHWCIHNLLHRVSWLWSFHRVHHSIEIMDWIGSMRFHWFESLIYKSITYPILSFFGFHIDILLLLAIVNTGMGHFNHANPRVFIGPLKYLLNNPAMHIWHHHRTQEGPIMCNFGINLSLWDWLFGTAYLPDQPPQRLGFDGIESFPQTAVGQVLYPLPVWKINSSAESDQSAKR